MTILDVIHLLLKSANKNKKNDTPKEIAIANKPSSKALNNSSSIFIGIIIIVVIIFVFIKTSYEINNIEPIAVACPSFMGQGASWDITQADGGYYVGGSFYSSTNGIILKYKSIAGSDCKLVY